MNLKRLLEVVQVQRHDFLNHLQVIYGLLLLDKTDQVKEYLDRVVLEVSRMSKTSGISMPEVTAALLIGLNEANKNQVNIDLIIQSDFAGCAVPGPVAGEAVNSCLDAVLCCLSGPGIINRQMEILLRESDKDCFCQVIFHQSTGKDYYHLESLLEPVKALLDPYGGNVKVTAVGNKLEVYLIFPCKV